MKHYQGQGKLMRPGYMAARLRMMVTMPRPGSPLLPSGASPADERDLRQILRSFIEQPPSRRLLVNLVPTIEKRFTQNDFRSRAKYLAEIALKEKEKYGIVPWLNKELIVVQGDRPRPRDVVAPQSQGISAEAIATMDAALQLPTDELATLAATLRRTALERRAQEEAERTQAQEQALGQIALLTQELETTSQKRVEAVITAKQKGATWAKIGEAAGVNRDVAFKRWAASVPNDED